ncbi:hypothetical protein C1J03_19645 [Sulfitobacter sp. SK012]|uniref:nickel/cobalt transporter n=1 Tax=Sulfitobacter sp. SK012 TaxID=1389005 RepID=UPI000E0A44C4|nr:hypothetical protein [Sulfitobacter sp. SK012]AXI48018.1 hypothetical protein C1J03_19645 [Sulfitobacter sp. SK012]
MPRILSISLLVLAAALAVLWFSGGFERIAVYAASEQRAFQNTIARTLRALRGGEPGALALLMSACFAYGFFHAVGPGHGKLLVGGYGLGRAVPMVRLSAIALISSLGQAVTAIILAYAGLWLLGATREAMIGTSEQIMAPASYAAIALIGGWLALRGMRRLIRARKTSGHDHHGESDTCESCGHRHGPSLEETQAAGTLREAVILIAGIAIRPCTGALFVLIITWQMGIAAAGIAGVFAMALGTGAVTVAVGLAASGFRGGILRGLAGAPALNWVIPVIEVVAGAGVLALSLGLLVRSI